jgi:YHS domain-containing protein
MVKDPICGMDVKKQGVLHVLDLEHETVYFCSNKCKETYTQQSGRIKKEKKKGVIARFLEKLAKENEQTYGGTPPKCH